MPSILRTLRTPKVRVVLRSHRGDLGAPGQAVGIVHGQEAKVSATGDAATDSPFVIGSATKSFTALAVLQLAEAGRVRLDEPTVRYVHPGGAPTTRCWVT